MLPTDSEKLAVVEKLIQSMIADYEFTDRRLGRKSWKTVADNLYTQLLDLQRALNNEGALSKEIYEKVREDSYKQL